LSIGSSIPQLIFFYAPDAAQAMQVSHIWTTTNAAQIAPNQISRAAARLISSDTCDRASRKVATLPQWRARRKRTCAFWHAANGGDSPHEGCV
jgi:hypothetical protein